MASLRAALHLYFLEEQNAPCLRLRSGKVLTEDFSALLVSCGHGQSGEDRIRTCGTA